MLQRLSVDGVEFKQLYIAENAKDVELAKANGIPYVRWKHGQDEFLRRLFRPALEQLFPGIDWNKVIGRKKPIKSLVEIGEGYINQEQQDIAEYDKDKMLDAQLAAEPHIARVLSHDWATPDDDGWYTREVPAAGERRDCIADNSDQGYNVFHEDKLSVMDYLGDITSQVNIDVLQKLGLMPKFMGDIVDCIRHNLSNSLGWTEGYTKKLGYPLGKFNSKKELPNLMIIDISASIPDGIAATMIALADTLRSECNADLIITSARSGFYESGSELPDPQTLRDYYGRSNESYEFMAILSKYVAGREWGNVISFGDNDSPGSVFEYARRLDMANTTVHAVWHYHTGVCWGMRYHNQPTGYARWVEEVCPDAEVHHDTSWCSVMKKHYHL